MRSKPRLISVFLLIFGILVILANLFTEDNMYNPARETPTVTITPTEIEVIDESTDVFHFEFQNIDALNNTLLFYTNHQEVYVYIGDEVVYSLGSADSIFGRTPGAVWNIVVLPTDVEQVSITITQVYPKLAKQEVEFELGNVVNMYKRVLDESVISVFLASTIIVIGVGLSAYWILVFRKARRYREILYLGYFAVIFGVWNFGETQYAMFLFNNRAFWTYLAYTCLMTMCLPAVYFFREFLEVKDRYIHRFITAYILIETVVCQVLHLTGIMSVKETTNYTIISIILILFYLLFSIVSSVKAKKNKRKITINVIGLTILVITAFVDISSYYIHIFKRAKVAKVGFLFYVILLGIETIRLARERLQEEQKLEIIKEMAVKDMLTGCYNRNAYSEDTSDISKLKGVQVITFDLNDLKKCNDVKGHKAGDTYIVDAANMIRRIFGTLGKVYRIGGDEFCIVTRHISEKTILQKKVDLNKAISMYLTEHEDSGFGIACGYAAYDEELDLTIEETRHRADLNMYENKKEIKG